MTDNHTEWHHAISDRTTTRTFKAGEVIAMQGEPSEFVGFILSGRAKAVSFSESGTATWVGHFQADDFFGHMSLLTNTPIVFEISAETDVTALIIRASLMRELLDNEKTLNQVLINNIAARLDVMTRRLIEALSLTTKGRICAELVRLSNVIGVTPQKSIIRPNPVLVDLAMRVNSTRETVSRTVSELQKTGVLSREPGAIIVENPGRLKSAIK